MAFEVNSETTFKWPCELKAVAVIVNVVAVIVIAVAVILQCHCYVYCCSHSQESLPSVLLQSLLRVFQQSLVATTVSKARLRRPIQARLLSRGGFTPGAPTLWEREAYCP